MTNLRRATDADVEAIVAMGLCFQATTTYALHLRATADTLRSLAVRMIGNPDAVIIVAERPEGIIGMIAATVYTHIMSGERIGTEVCWWMNPDARGGRTALQLIRAAEDWAIGQGAVIFQMMAPTEQVETLYRKLHYTQIETHYQRRVA